MSTAIRLLTRLHGSTPLGAARAGHTLAEDGGPIFVVEGRDEIALTASGAYARPSGHDVTQFGSVKDATEYALRRGWNAAALSQWATDYGLTLPVSA